MLSMHRALAAAVVMWGACAPCPSRAALSPASLQVISHTSELLSRFWGTPVDMQAAAFVPARCRQAEARCAVLYHLPGYGGSLATAWSTMGEYVRLSARVPRLAMAQVFVDPTTSNGGYSYFTDSENNGPWDSALTQELIPYVEALLGVGGSGRRFLAGHSSGGWAVTWLQVSHPEFFSAVWAIAPDPLDFRYFYHVDATPGSSDNFYSKPNGAPRYLTRRGGTTMRHLMQDIDDVPSQGGIISSYEFAWSPRGPDGLPLRLFDRADGALEEATLEAWQAYDVEAVLDRGGATLREALGGKVNIYCGARDDFSYNQPTSALCRFLRAAHYAAVCRVVPGRTHSSIFRPTNAYPLGLRRLILSQASALAGAAAR